MSIVALLGSLARPTVCTLVIMSMRLSALPFDCGKVGNDVQCSIW